MKSQDYTYHLPQERIALHPLPERDASKLLVADGTKRTIAHHTFRDLASLLPAHSTLVVNSTRVIAARLHLRKPTGGVVEVLLSKPLHPSSDPMVVLHANTTSTWECIIGGRNVHEGMELHHDGVQLRVTVVSKHGNEAVVELQWDTDEALATVIGRAGEVPLPPYLHREATADDVVRYQTVFARDEGSVAAPTAALHFTERVLADIAAKSITRVDVVLHVGLGTFAPMHDGDVRDHVMHGERFGIDRASLQTLIDSLSTNDAWLTVVGTTSLRTIESIALMGARLTVAPDAYTVDHVVIEQWSAFDDALATVDRIQAFKAVAAWMDAHNCSMLWGETNLMIAPGAALRTADALITNFHQPGTSLMLLVAAFVGDPFWRDIYDAALNHEYRFLSYGDSSLLIRSVLRPAVRST